VDNLHDRKGSENTKPDEFNEKNYGLRWAPTDDPIELNKRLGWELFIRDYMDRIDRFNRSKKKHGKEHLKILAKYFVRKTYEMNIDTLDLHFESANEETGWIRSSIIEKDLVKNISNRNTIFRLLADMVDSEFLQKRNVVVKSVRSSNMKKKPNVYYRLLIHEPLVSQLQIKTREELLTEAIKYYKAFRKYGELYLGAKEWLMMEGFAEKDVDPYLRDGLRSWKEYEGGNDFPIEMQIKRNAFGFRMRLNFKFIEMLESVKKN